MLWFDQKQLSAKIVKLIGNPRIEQLCLFLVVFLSFVFKLQIKVKVGSRNTFFRAFGTFLRGEIFQDILDFFEQIVEKVEKVKKSIYDYEKIYKTFTPRPPSPKLEINEEANHYSPNFLRHGQYLQLIRDCIGLVSLGILATHFIKKNW